MPTVEIPLLSPTYRSVDGKELDDYGYRIVDGYIDEMNAFISRPGLGSFHDLGLTGKGVDGLYWWDEKEVAIAVCNGQVYKLEYDGTTVTATDLTGSSLTPDKRPTFATDGDNLVITSGGSAVYTDGVSSTAFFSDPDVPSQSSFAAYLDGYILLQDENYFYWSEVQDYDDWGALNFADPIALPDKLKALYVFNRQIYLFGNRSIEVWANDGANPFLRIPGGFSEIGIAAPHSVLEHEGQIYWLATYGDTKAFTKFAGGRHSRMFTPYDDDIAKMSSVSSCRADKVSIDGKPFFLWSFPGNEKTYAYNLLKDDWSEFGYWNVGTSNYTRWLGNQVIYAPAWNKTLVAGRSDSIIYDMSRDYLDDNGDPIRPSKKTGHITHQTHNRKRSKKITMKAKRGYTDQSSAPTLVLRWSDDGTDEWCEGEEISLGETGDTEMFVEIGPTGMYRSRQYELYTTDPIKVILQQPREDIEVLLR